MVNLLTNAIEATEAAGRRDAIILRVRRAVQLPELVGGRSDTAIAVEVTDRGVGIDPETIQRMFEPGFSTKQLNAAQRVRGLGMISVRLFVNEAGGTVQVQSVPGEGTRIALILPARETRPEGAFVASSTVG